MEAWKERLVNAMKERDISLREASIKSGHGAGYVHSMLKDGKDPSFAHLLEVCNAIGISGAFVLFGLDVTPQTERLLRLMRDRPDQVEGILKILGDDPQ